MNCCMNYYLRDLSSRQNRPVTSAQIHLYLDAKRYTNKEIEECTRIMCNQLNLEDVTTNDEPGSGKHIDSKEELERQLTEKYKEIEELKRYYNEKLEQQKPENFFIYEKKLVMLDDKAGHLVLKYKSDLFDELITEFRKLYSWLDNRVAYLKFNVDESDYVIDKTEIKTVIHFFEKLNKIQNKVE